LAFSLQKLPALAALAIYRCQFSWQPLADAPDANAQSLDLFCEEFSDGVISLTGYAPKSLEMRISVGGNQS
jgi:hypothetical protein